MKNYATFVTALYDGIFQDAAIRWPAIKDSMDKDSSYLRRAAKDRGEAFFTLTLPLYGKLIDRWLDAGRMLPGDQSEDWIPEWRTADIPRGIPMYDGRPELFSGFLNMIFSDDGVLLVNVEPDVVLFLRTLCRICEKLEAPVSFTALRKSIREFLRCGKDSSEKLSQHLGQ